MRKSTHVSLSMILFVEKSQSSLILDVSQSLCGDIVALTVLDDKKPYLTRCPRRDKDLSTLPRDMTICPYCSKTISK